MAFFPISHTVSQYEDTNGEPFSGAVLKAYEAGAAFVNIPIATDATGTTTVATVTLNSDGYPEVSGNIIIPFINEKYKLALYPDQAAADSDTGAIWIIDNVPVATGDLFSVTRIITTTTTLDSSDANTHIEASGNITITLPAVSIIGSGFLVTIRNAGTGTVEIAGNGAETVNGSASIFLAPSESGWFISDSTNFNALLTRTPLASKGSDVASAASTDIWVSTGELIHITGTTTITSFDTASRAGESRFLIFDDVVTITDGANLVVPGSANYDTSVDDIIVVRADTTTKHYITIIKSNGEAVIAPPPASEIVAGIAELATQAEVDTGTDTTRIVTPATLQTKIDDSILADPSVAIAAINFDGTGVVSIRRSFGVSSLVDNATGDYTVNLSTSPGSDFITVPGGTFDNNTSGPVGSTESISVTPISATAVTFETRISTGTRADDFAVVMATMFKT